MRKKQSPKLSKAELERSIALAREGVINTALEWRKADLALLQNTAFAMARGTIQREATFLRALADKAEDSRRRARDAASLLANLLE